MSARSSLSSPFLLHVLDHLPIAVFILEAVYSEQGLIQDFNFLYANEVGLALTQRRRENVLGQAFSSVFPQFKKTQLRENFLLTLEKQRSLCFDLKLKADDVLEYCYNVHTKPVPDAIVATFEDVSEKHRLESRIRAVALEDELTGLHNRRFLLTRAPKLIALARRQTWPVSIVYFDLNGFKQVNDLYGHLVGDRLLKAVATRLQGLSREGDILVRWGGDEFVIFLPHTSKAEAQQAAERIAEALLEPFKLDGVLHIIGASIGVTSQPGETAQLDLLLKEADEAMYRAKTRKKDELSPISS